MPCEVVSLSVDFFHEKCDGQNCAESGIIIIIRIAIAKQ
jgi:hypothetical protein